MALGAYIKKGLSVIKAFGKQAGAAARTNRASFMKRAAFFAKRDIGVRATTGFAKGVVEKSPGIMSSIGRSRIVRGTGWLAKQGYRLGTSTPALALGAVSMMGLSVMKGGMNQAKDIVHERYMQDYTYSTSMLHNSRVGLTSGTNRMLNRAATQGLSNALHKTRHGRY